jgi:hypothetical protein
MSDAVDFSGGFDPGAGGDGIDLSTYDGSGMFGNDFGSLTGVGQANDAQSQQQMFTPETQQQQTDAMFQKADDTQMQADKSLLGMNAQSALPPMTQPPSATQNTATALAQQFNVGQSAPPAMQTPAQGAMPMVQNAMGGQNNIAARMMAPATPPQSLPPMNVSQPPWQQQADDVQVSKTDDQQGLAQQFNVGQAAAETTPPPAAQAPVQPDPFTQRWAQQFPQGTVQRQFQDLGAKPWQMQTIQIESGFRANQTTGSNQGFGQFGPDEQRQFGVKDPNDPAQVLQGLTNERNSFEKGLGRPISDGEFYMMHQQGRAGGPALMNANPNTPAWQAVRQYYPSDAVAQRAIWGNVPTDKRGQFGNDVNNVSAGQFTNLWTSRFGGGAAPTAQTVAAKPSSQPASGPLDLSNMKVDLVPGAGLARQEAMYGKSGPIHIDVSSKIKSAMNNGTPAANAPAVAQHANTFKAADSVRQSMGLSPLSDKQKAALTHLLNSRTPQQSAPPEEDAPPPRIQPAPDVTQERLAASREFFKNAGQNTRKTT